MVFVFKLSDPDDPCTAKAVAEIVSDDTELGLLNQLLLLLRVLAVEDYDLEFTPIFFCACDGED